MPLKRTSSIPFEYAAVQLLAYLAVDGYLDRVPVPDWAEDTSVSELMQALDYLSSDEGNWLQEFYPNHGKLEAADAWLTAWHRGETVPLPEDCDEDDDETDDEDPSESMIKEFIKSLPFDERVKMQQEINSNPSIREAMRGIIEPTASIAASVGLQEEQDYPDDKSNFLEVIKPHASCKPVLMFAIMLLNEGVEHIRSVIDDRMDTDHIDARIAELIDECNQLMKPKKKKTSR